jgi:hypothetical protein
MTIEELKARLVEAKIPEDAYCLTGGLPNEACTIEQAGGEWRVYYSERGQRTGLKSFSTEQEAADYFLPWILRDFLPEHS